MDNSLFTNIIDANIEKSLYIATELLLKDTDKNMNIIHHTIIAVCSYIGSFVSLCEIKLFLEITNYTTLSINDDQIIIKNLYIVITKMCILCDIFKSHPVSRVGIIPVKTLRSKVIGLFENNNCSLTDSGLSKFKEILPPFESPTFQLALQIISSFVETKKTIEMRSADDDFDELSDTANKLRHFLDYIVRKKFIFETSFYPTDTDSIWFLWGLISVLFNNEEIDMVYYLFSHEYKKKIKQQRIGLLWVTGLVMVYICKKDVARNWNSKEKMIISKIEEVHMELYKDIKNDFSSKHEIPSHNIHEHHGKQGIDYLQTYRPKIQQDVEYTSTECTKPEIRKIKYRSKY